MIVACQWNTAMERKGEEALDEGNSIIHKIKKEIHLKGRIQREGSVFLMDTEESSDCRFFGLEKEEPISLQTLGCFFLLFRTIQAPKPPT